MAALPGLQLGRAAVLTQTTTSVANTLPGGGAIAVGLTYTILKSWGFTGTEVALYVGVTGIWNIFVKLALPVISLVFLAIAGESGSRVRRRGRRSAWSCWRSRSRCSRRSS